MKAAAVSQRSNGRGVGEKAGEKNKLREGVRGGQGGYLSWGRLPAQHRYPVCWAAQVCACAACRMRANSVWLHGTLLLCGAYARGVLPSAWVATYCCLNSACGEGRGVRGWEGSWLVAPEWLRGHGRQLVCSHGVVAWAGSWCAAKEWLIGRQLEGRRNSAGDLHAHLLL